MMTSHYRKVFYMAIFAICMSHMSQLGATDFSSVHFLNVVYPLNFLEYKGAVAFLISSASVALAFLGIFWSPTILSGLFCVSFTLSAFVYLSLTGAGSNYLHIWIFASAFLCFLRVDRALGDPRNLLILRLIQCSLLSGYFISGLWKLRNWNRGPVFQVASNLGLNHIATAMSEGHGPSPVIAGMIHHPWAPAIVGGGFSLAVLFQLSTIIPVLTGRSWLAWGIMANVFHFITGIALGLWYAETTIASLFFLVITEQMIVMEREHSWRGKEPERFAEGAEARIAA